MVQGSSRGKKAAILVTSKPQMRQGWWNGHHSILRYALHGIGAASTPWLQCLTRLEATL